MSKIVEVKGVGNVEFPDTMSDDQIGSILAKTNFGPEKVGTLDAAVSGGLQGASLGYGDEMEAGWKSLFPKSMGGSDYTEERNRLRSHNDSARAQHPYAFGGSEIAGSMLPAAVMAAASGGASLPMAAGQGALQGAGYSDADSAKGLARDAGIGLGLGTLGYGAGQGLGFLGRKAAGSFRGLAVRAQSRAAEKAANEVAGGISSAKGALGAEVQKGSRLIENLQRFGTELGPEEQAAADALTQRVEASNLRSLPDQAATIAAKDAELQAAQQGASGALKTRTAELLSTGEVKQQLLARALRYGPVAAGSVAGHMIGGPVGGAVGALAGAGTRPMVRSLLRMASSPAVQNAAGNFMANRAEGATATLLRKAIQAGLPAAATQQLVTQ